MDQSTYITIGLILLGALILLLAIFRTFQIFKLVTLKKFRRNWKNLFILMSFFLVGYLGVIYMVVDNMENLLLVMIGVIFFFGAVFVFIVTSVGLGTFKRLQELNTSLEAKVDELKIQNEEMQQFNYATSHDLQEPLNTLITSMSLLEEQHSDKLDDTAKRMMHYSVKAADRMRELIESLSLYLKIGRDRQYKQTNLNELAKEVLEEIQGSIQATNAEINIQKLPTLFVNDRDIKRIFQNLISNAIKYRKLDTDPKINIEAQKESKKHWRFKVEDNGIGIEKEHFDRVFQIFKQLHPKEKYEGMGIGLSICKKVVELHGGTIWPESREGEGTTFYFTLRG